MTNSKHYLRNMMDYSLLKPFFTESEVRAGCEEAVELDVASICVRPCDVPMAASILKGSDVKVSTVIGFPHGTTTTQAKLAEAEEALGAGCEELDMVVNIAWVKSGNWDAVYADVRQVLEATHAAGAKLKLIFENCFLDEAEKIRLCELCNELNVDWAKTSTGFGTGGATDEDLVLMRKHCQPHVQVKAAGGVRDLDRALRVRAIGVTRIGCTASREILENLEKAQSGS